MAHDLMLVSLRLETLFQLGAIWDWSLLRVGWPGGNSRAGTPNSRVSAASFLVCFI